MNVIDLIEELKSLNDDLKEKKVCVVAENGMLLPVRVTFELKDKHDVFNRDSENVNSIVLTW